MESSKKKGDHAHHPIYYLKFGYLLNRTGSLGAASMSDLLKQFDLPLPYWHILLTLSEFRDQSITELASHTGLEMSYLSRTVIKVEKRGYVKRSRSTNDKRILYVSLTKEGRQIIDQIVPKTHRLLEIIFQGVSDSDVETTARTLQSVYDNLASNPTAASENVNFKLVVAKRTGKSRNKLELPAQ